MFTQRTIGGGTPGETEKIETTNAPQRLPDSILFRNLALDKGDTNNKCQICIITVEDNDIRYSHKQPPLADTAGSHGHVAKAGSMIKLSSWGAVKSFRYISKNLNNPAVLQVTPQY